MSTTFLTFYVLIWPVMVAIVLAVIVRAFLSELRTARREDRPLI